MPEPAPTEPKSREAALPLGAWLNVFSPAYRGKMAGLFGLNILSAVGTFIELQLLRALTVVLSGPPAPAQARCSLSQWFASGLTLTPEPCGASLPLFLLLTYTASILVQSSFDLAAYTLNSRLNQVARHDVERELMRNLLQQDDAFYIRRSPAEIMSRLGNDLDRVGERRRNVTEGSATALSIIATVLVLVSQSWLAAGIGLVICAIGIVSAQPRLRKLRMLNRDSTLNDERVKAAFEDTLQGAAEIQVSGLLGRMLQRFDERQTARDRIALMNAGLTNRNRVYQKLTFTLGFIAVLTLFVTTDLFRDPSSGSVSAAGTATAGLIVVLIATLPELYFKFDELTQRLTLFQIAGESVRRLMQYAAPAATRPAPAAPRDKAQTGAIVLSGVRYQFSGSDAVQGGPQGITCVVPPRGMTGIVGPAGAGKSTLLRLVLGRQKASGGSIALPDAGARGTPFVYLPQRPVLFDARLRDNLFPDRPAADAAARLSSSGPLGRLGLLDLIRLKGLDALPSRTHDIGADLPALRAGFREAVKAALQTPLNPLGPGHASPRQTAIESQLACAADQTELAHRLTSPMSRAPVRALAALSYGRDMAPFAISLIRQSAPMLRTGNVDEYNRIATFKIDPAIFQLRVAALDIVMGAPDGPLDGPPHPLLVALSLSARLEELDAYALPSPQADARAHLEALVAGISRPLEADRVNPLLPWRENLLFAVPDPTNIRRLAQMDRVLLDHLRSTSLDNAVIEAGLDYPVGRQGGRLSGGQQQLVGLGRALLNPAPFLVLDEPSSAFHPKLRLDAISVLQEEARSRAVIVVTHDFELARACDQLFFVRDGALAGQGSWTSLVAEDKDGFGAWVAQSKGTA